MDLLKHEPHLAFNMPPESANPVRAIWAKAESNEPGAPERRIIHSREIRSIGRMRVDRVGIRLAPGYNKCGSIRSLDWITHLKVLGWKEGAWKLLSEGKDLPRPRGESYEDTVWIEVGAECEGVILQARQAGIDRWWSIYSLLEHGVTVEGEILEERIEGTHESLTLRNFDPGSLPSGVRVERYGSDVLFSTRFYRVAFSLYRPTMTSLALDSEGSDRLGKDLLVRRIATRAVLGLVLHPIGAASSPAEDIHASQMTGESEVRGNILRYRVEIPAAKQTYELQWEFLEDRILSTITRTGGKPIRAWRSSALSLAFDSTVSVVATLGEVVPHGEAGVMKLPVLVHAPGQGTLQVTATEGEGLWRFDSNRPTTLVVGELKVGEQPQEEGDYLLPEGHHCLRTEWKVVSYPAKLSPGTPPVVRRAIERCGYTTMTYRADTHTFSNNGNSIHAPLCFELWAALAKPVGRLLPNLRAMDLLIASLQRWLDDAPGYGSGRLASGEEVEHQYSMTRPVCLIAVAEILEDPAVGRSFFKKNREAIHAQWLRLREQDFDGDSLLESTRKGVSGQHEWSSNWWDVISFGWKDAWVNAFLYIALVRLEKILASFGETSWSGEVAQWAERLRAAYRPAFWNEATQRFAGWRCAEGELHDYAFLFVNATAVQAGLVSQEEGRKILLSLWNDLKASGAPALKMGLPGNLIPVPDKDMAAPMHHQGYGFYENGGLTHSLSQYFVNALYQVGLVEEGDELLEDLCHGLANGSAFAGVGSGVDWRYWDGTPCGYEGLLADQFGIIGTALSRYAGDDNN